MKNGPDVLGTTVLGWASPGVTALWVPPLFKHWVRHPRSSAKGNGSIWLRRSRSLPCNAIYPPPVPEEAPGPNNEGEHARGNQGYAHCIRGGAVQEVDGGYATYHEG
jgi:hypothetical protein